jgi:hypothetical protein
MRLPSQASVDSHDMLREIALQMGVDGPEEVILADDYVNERSVTSQADNTDSCKRPAPPVRSITRLEKVTNITHQFNFYA